MLPSRRLYLALFVSVLYVQAVTVHAFSTQQRRHQYSSKSFLEEENSLTEKRKFQNGVSSITLSTAEVIIQSKKAQDRLLQVSPAAESGPGAAYSIFGVFDGHGHTAAAADGAKEYVRSNLVDFLQSKSIDLENVSESDLQSAMTKFFSQMEQSVEKSAKVSHSGSTVSLILLTKSNNKLFTVNLGDSGSHAFFPDGTDKRLTKDQVPEDEEEQKLIKSTSWARGRFFDAFKADSNCLFGYQDTKETTRICNGEKRVLPVEEIWRVVNKKTGLGLRMTRSIGDTAADPCLLRDPVVKEFCVYCEKPAFILLASDGLWEYERGIKDTAKIIRNELKDQPAQPLEAVLEKGVREGNFPEWDCHRAPHDDTAVLGLFFKWEN
uniref:PPM-type phosphatase domain-containing protein n=1 Tax=Chromera velia CCMP2878 TaxID=1169474 RepID=A0A0G4IB99_9ALVE|eukprot:Cvel_2150.t1-p1 / transcript=Cvel_2150.t1 / gene=Cvel_2150 / organism=Chromera_velia_CCMP2878 / gene_product=hypothetical protein / transcript_product=hypothetical protein / location=Cvel_scaffold83:103621-104754(-) / protein_length=378 / sequence_SO=supercontig / SO=protein_coding / is_pseudo=false